MTKIEWAEETWNPIAGCEVISPGCTNCYAMRQAARIVAMQRARYDLWRDEISNVAPPDISRIEPFSCHYEGTTKKVNGKDVWTGKAALAPEHILTKPLCKKKPTVYFVNSMGDLFYKGIREEWIDRIFAVAALCPQHKFLILTKRAERMREYFLDGRSRENAVYRRMVKIPGDRGRPVGPWWPLPNVWLGVSAEDQTRADERIPLLLDTPASLRWVSAEPLLGPVDFTRLNEQPRGQHMDALRGKTQGFLTDYDHARLDWIVVGGESGRGARPFDIGWARSTIAQCKAANIPMFVKQLGSRVYDDSRKADMPPFPADAEPEDIAVYTRGFTRVYFNHAKGGDPAEWPEDLRVREFPQTEGAKP